MVRGPRRRSVVARLLPVLLAPLLATALPACSEASTAPLPADTVLIVTGHGYGHGHGMSQYGARGAALRGRSERQILSFFYPHTNVGAAGGRISVLITKNTARTLSVQTRPGLVAQQSDKARTWNLTRLQPKATRWRIVPAAGGRNELDYLLRGWHRQSVVASTLQFAAGGAPIRLYLPQGSAQYHGILRAAMPNARSLDRDTVNVVGLQDYVRGVVPTEMPASWPQAAVRAQAVAARTYAVFERAANPHRYYQICDTSTCQNYGGYSAEASGSNQAAAATAGQILTYGGRPAFTQFAASDGGWSRSGGQPYLTAKQDVFEPYAHDPYRTWTTKVTVGQLEKWFGVTQISSVSVTRDATKHWVEEVVVHGPDGSTASKSGDDFKRAAQLRSAWFSFKRG